MDLQCLDCYFNCVGTEFGSRADFHEDSRSQEHSQGISSSLFSDLQLLQLLLLSPSQCEMGNMCSRVLSSKREFCWQEPLEAGNVSGWRAREGAQEVLKDPFLLLGAAAAADRWWWNSTPGSAFLLLLPLPLVFPEQPAMTNLGSQSMQH